MCETALEVESVTTESMRKRATSPMLAKLDAAAEAVYAADAAWYEDLGSDEKKAAYKAAKAAYEALAEEAVSRGVADDCRRCGGAGGWAGWPGFTCFECGGDGLGPYKRVRFQAMPPTRAKREAKCQAVATAKQAKREENWSAFAREHPVEADVLASEHRKMQDEGYSFLGSLWDKVGDYGSLSDKQMACVTRELEKRADEAAAVEFPHGTATVEGEIVSLPQSRGYIGGNKTNMLVKLASHRGNKVMGTVPEKVWRAMESDDPATRGQLVGSTVRFTAQFTQSVRDPHFGFFKSPKGVEVLDVAGLNEEG